MSSPYFVVNSGLSGLGNPAPRTQVSYDEWVRNTTRDWLAANPNAPLTQQTQTGLQIGTALAAVGGITAAFGLYQLVTGKTKSGVPLALLGAAGVAGGIWQNKRAVENAAGDTSSPFAIGSKPGVAEVNLDAPKIGLLQRATDGLTRTLGLA